MNSANVDFVFLFTLFMPDFTFLFLNVHFKFGPELSRGCNYIPFEHSHVFLDFFETFIIVFF